MLKKPGMERPAITWVRGPRVDEPADVLLAWLAQHAGKLTRVPLVLGRGPVGFSARDVLLGTARVRITDAALGISITMRARKSQGPTAAFVAEGRWQDDHFAITYTSTSPISDAELAAVTHLEVEAP